MRSRYVLVCTTKKKKTEDRFCVTDQSVDAPGHDEDGHQEVRHGQRDDQEVGRRLEQTERLR